MLLAIAGLRFAEFEFEFVEVVVIGLSFLYFVSLKIWHNEVHKRYTICCLRNFFQ